MLYEHHFRAMNTGVGVWVWSTDTERTSMIRGDAVGPVRTLGAWQRIEMDDAARSVDLPEDLAVDLGGIAKGWTVDRVALALARRRLMTGMTD
jgi:thiamine biosynthesis lipoprotein ApbE